MPLSRQDKQQAMEVYAKHAGDAKNVVLVTQRGVTVNEINELRKKMVETGGKMQVVKKRIFLRAMNDAGMEDVKIDVLNGNVIALYAKDENEYAPLKAIYDMNKQLKKDKKKYEFEYVGGWYEKQWKDAEYVKTLASLPSKEELVGKFLFLLNYPVQSLAATLKQVAEKKETEGN